MPSQGTCISHDSHHAVMTADRQHLHGNAAAFAWCLSSTDNMAAAIPPTPVPLVLSVPILMHFCEHI